MELMPGDRHTASDGEAGDNICVALETAESRGKRFKVIRKQTSHQRGVVTGRADELELVGDEVTRKRS